MNLGKHIDAMNRPQRIGAFITIVLILLIVVLHGPWDGYSTTRYYPGLPELGLPGSISDLSFLDWTTNAPVIAWFGTILHTLVAIAISILGFAIWHYLFRTSSSASPSKSAPEERA